MIAINPRTKRSVELLDATAFGAVSFVPSLQTASQQAARASTSGTEATTAALHPGFETSKQAVA